MEWRDREMIASKRKRVEDRFTFKYKYEFIKIDISSNVNMTCMPIRYLKA